METYMTHPNNGIILGVDLDGVCADFYARIREIAAEWFERDISTLTQDVSYGLPEWGLDPDEYEKIHRFAVTQRDLFGSVKMIPGARKHLRKLSNEGYKIRIITHRLFIQFFHKMAVTQTVEWLDLNGIPYWDICFLKEKEQVNADIYIEDSPGNITALREKGLNVICFANSTNKEVSEPRARDWGEVYKFIKQFTNS
jgi:5'(3')-deoxyribonucleotidase